MTDKINFETFLDETEWESSDKAYWKQLFKGTYYWGRGEQYWMFEEKENEIWNKLKHLKFIPYMKDGELHLSVTYNFQKLIKRLRYAMRGNTIPNYGLKFEEVIGGWILTIDGRKFERVENSKNWKEIVDKKEEVVTME